VDPDGKAFYVAVGDIGAMTTTLKADYIPVWDATAGDYKRVVEFALDEEIQQMLVDKYNEGYSYSSLVVDKDNNPTA
ncbi:hypothetical protein JVW19_23705, partial [Vibrio cholerae O1]|nr:hypothetical protein [Vibrio cholerae O1]